MDPLEEELLAVEAIFPECVRQDSLHHRQLLIYPDPDGACKNVWLRLSFPTEYPETAPMQTACSGISQSMIHELIQNSWSPGEFCLFALIDKLREILVNEPNDSPQTEEDLPRPAASSSSVRADNTNVAEEYFEFAISRPIIDRKSIFIGRAIEVHTQSEAHYALNWLKISDKKVARATHNIVAWRIMENDILIRDNDDDGEDAAGGRLAHLLEMTNVKNVMVVVSRWYGGIMLHGDRFKHISNAARDALEIGGFLRDSQRSAEKTASLKGRKYR